MSSICLFEMRLRGTKENCYAMVNSVIPCYDAYIYAEKGYSDDYMVYLRGACRYSVSGSMVYVNEDETLAAKAKKFNIELEVCGLNEEYEEIRDKYHYKGDKVIKEIYLPSYIEAWEIEEDECELSEEELAKYEKNEECDVYVLKDEYDEQFEFDHIGNPIFNFTMSFKDLSGFEELEEDSEEIKLIDPFRDNESILAELTKMGIRPDENGFAILYCEDEYGDVYSVNLHGYFGNDKKVIVPYGVTELELECFSSNEEVEEIILPDTLKYIGPDCFQNCPKLKKIIIPASVESFWEDDNTFGGSENVVIYTPAGSLAEKFAKERNIKVSVL